MEKLMDIGQASALAEGLTFVERDGLRCVLLKNASGVHAFSAMCPHVAGPMQRAEVDGNVVSCPLHGWQFDLADGGREINGYRPLQTFDIVDVDGHLQVKCDAAGRGMRAPPADR
jgi:nitrite reductase (NADH) small subunit